MDRFVDDRDFALLRQDPYTFSVLDRILRGPCACVRSDHSRLILCHSEAPYPVWIWTPDGLSEAEKAAAWALAAECCPLEAGYRLMMKYELAAYFLAQAGEAGMKAGICKELFAYACPRFRASRSPARLRRSSASVSPGFNVPNFAVFTPQISTFACIAASCSRFFR